LTKAIYATDLHGSTRRYNAFFQAIREEKPAAVFLGGDLLPSCFKALEGGGPGPDSFIKDFLGPALSEIKALLGEDYPYIFAILGNDDLRIEEAGMRSVEDQGLLSYVHGRKVPMERWTIYGYSYVNPSPFLLKDWERYDVSRYVDPGCVSPEEGHRSVHVTPDEQRFSTIKEDLDHLTAEDDLADAVFLFHAPPHGTDLDRAALDGKLIEGIQPDVHVGSIAVRRFIEERQPLLTLHGHIHESAGLTGSWKQRVGRTWMFSAAHGGPELALIRFDLENPGEAVRELI
jgi:Icc-related predicted phosphoesterase